MEQIKVSVYLEKLAFYRLESAVYLPFAVIAIYRSSGSSRKRASLRFRCRHAGFTLPELVVTLAVAAILVTVAVPNFRTFIQNSRINGTADNFLAALQQARSEAITRGDKVILCRTADPSTDGCGDSGDKDWASGWLMYAVPTEPGEVNYTASGDNVLIRRGLPAAQGVAVTSDTDGNTWLTFGGDGTLDEPMGNGDNVVLYAVCDDRGEDAGKLVVIPLIGRPYLTDDLTNAPGCAPNS